MAQYIDKDALVKAIKKLKDDAHNGVSYHQSRQNIGLENELSTWGHLESAFATVLKIINTLEVKDPYEQTVQYDSIKAGIQAHAKTYSFNIESELFNQLTKEQQKLWRKEIEQACISGGEAGVELTRDTRYKENLEVKEVDLYNNGWIDCTKQMPPETKQTSDTLQGHREWTESDRVLVWDSMYGCSVDVTKNGKWMSEQRGGYTGQVVHGITAWRPIPEFSEELLFKAQKGE